MFSVTFESFDKAAALAYAEQLKAAGFTVNASVTDTEGMYMYSAENSNGDKVSFSTPCLLSVELGK